MLLYKLLKKTDVFVWTEEAQQVLEILKVSLTSAPILIAPEQGEPLLLYVAASNHVVSAALAIEREEPGHQIKVQRPVYFIREVLTDPKVAETPVRHADGDLKVPALLHRPQSHSRHFIPTQGHHPQP